MYKKRSFRRPVRRPRRKAGKKSSVSAKIKSYVKRAIHRNIENKEIISYGANNSMPTAGSGGSFAPVGVGLTPYISQGTGDNNRTGNEVKVVSGIVRGHVNIMPYNATTNPNGAPLYVRIMVLRHLGVNGQVTPVSNLAWDNIFRGNGSALPFQANLLDMSLPINQEFWRLEAQKVVKLGVATSTGTTVYASYYDNSSMSAPFYFNWGKMMRKVIKYPDATNISSNSNLYLVFQPVMCDGQSTGGQIPAEFHYVSTCKFEDA